MQPTTVPNDAEAIAALTDGERRVAEKNPRAAEISFQKVLARYPDQIRAWYGLGLVALLDHDGPRAREVFGRLTSGEHAATQDPIGANVVACLSGDGSMMRKGSKGSPKANFRQR